MTSPPQTPGFPLRPQARAWLCAWSLILLSGFILAFLLEPDPRGYGTHLALGLPPCTFRMLLGIPCPSCGMTTSFSYFVRGQFVQSFQSNAAGFLLAVVCSLQIPWCWWSIHKRSLWRITQPERALLIVVGSLCVVSVANWIYRLDQG